MFEDTNQRLAIICSEFQQGVSLTTASEMEAFELGWCSVLVTPNRGCYMIKYVSLAIWKGGVFEWLPDNLTLIVSLWGSVFWLFPHHPVDVHAHCLIRIWILTIGVFPHSSDCVSPSRWQRRAGLWGRVVCPQTLRMAGWKISYLSTSWEPGMEEEK